MHFQGRRGEVAVDTSQQPWVATKKALAKNRHGALQKEVAILKKLEEQGIAYVPHVKKSGDGRFSYLWIPGESFHTVFASQSTVKQHLLIHELIDKAYELDTLGIVHGELDRPMSNILVDLEKLENNEPALSFIDFERGHWHDFSGKNLRHVMQWLQRLGTITPTQCKQWGSFAPDILYSTLTKQMLTYGGQSKKTMIVFLGGMLLLIGTDMLTKRLFYTLRILEDTWLITPVLNTGVGRSIPVPLVVTITGALLIACLLLRRSWSKKNYPWRAVFFLAGALGNMIDRIRLGGVRDFLDLHRRPVFNLADVFLTIACLLLLIASFTDRSKKI